MTRRSNRSMQLQMAWLSPGIPSCSIRIAGGSEVVANLAHRAERHLAEPAQLHTETIGAEHDAVDRGSDQRGRGLRFVALLIRGDDLVEARVGLVARVGGAVPSEAHEP